MDPERVWTQRELRNPLDLIVLFTPGNGPSGAGLGDRIQRAILCSKLLMFEMNENIFHKSRYEKIESAKDPHELTQWG